MIYLKSKPNIVLGSLLVLCLIYHVQYTDQKGFYTSVMRGNHNPHFNMATFSSHNKSPYNWSDILILFEVAKLETLIGINGILHFLKYEHIIVTSSYKRDHFWLTIMLKYQIMFDCFPFLRVAISQHQTPFFLI